MEFSFDRSRDPHLRQPENKSASGATPQQPQAPLQSGGVKAGPDLNTVDPSTIANERLRKAIERNRAKQAGREGAVPGAAQNPPPPPRPEQHQQASFFSQPEEVRPNPDKENTRPASPLPPRGTSIVSRRSVAKPEDTEFVPVKRTPRKVASQISYTTTSTRKKGQQVDPKYIAYLVKGCWIFCALMVLRLIFAAGGVTDYYSQKNSVNARLTELSAIKKENMQLVQEIERMRSDTGFQKKLVRDNLGFIASDEFLVLFPKD